MTVRELMTTWGFDINMKPLAELDEHIKGVKETLLHLGELVLGEGASLFGLAESTADAGVGFKRAAEMVGTTTTKLQELQYVAKQWDMRPEAVESALSRVSRLAVTAAQGSTGAIRTLGMVGINSFRDVNGQMLRSDQLLMQMAAHFKTMPNDAMKAGLIVQALGRGGKELMPLLNRMDEFAAKAKEGRDLGYVMNEEAIKESEKFKESTNQVRAMLVGLRNTIGVALMPAIENMVNEVRNWYMANREVITSQIVEFAHQLGNVVHGAFDMVVQLTSGVMWLANVLGGLGNVLKLVTAGFIAWTAMGIITELYEMVEVIMKIASALRLAAFWEGIMTGGLSTVLGLAAAGAAVGVGAYAFHEMNGPANSRNFAPAGGGPVHITSTHKWDVHLPPGTTQEQADNLGQLLDQKMKNQLRNLAYAGSSPQSH